nr:MAG TPA: hypothetical protein [Bacteriophage sp.]
MSSGGLQTQRLAARQQRTDIAYISKEDRKRKQAMRTDIAYIRLNERTKPIKETKRNG